VVRQYRKIDEMSRLCKVHEVMYCIYFQEIEYMGRREIVLKCVEVFQKDFATSRLVATFY